MTENKRFTKLTSSIDHYSIWDNVLNKGLTVDDAISVLNIFVTQYQKLEKKNEELKYALSEMNAMYDEALASDCETERENSLLLDDVKQLKKENEQLKQQVDEMIIIFENSGLDYHISDELNEILNR